MASRPGSLDPGVVTWLIARRRLDAGEVERQLYGRSGLTGLAGTGGVVGTAELDEVAGQHGPALIFVRRSGDRDLVEAGLAGQPPLWIFPGSYGAPVETQVFAIGLSPACT